MEESLEIWPNRLFGKHSSSYTEPKPKQTKEQCVCVCVFVRGVGELVCAKTHSQCMENILWLDWQFFMIEKANSGLQVACTWEQSKYST